MAVATVAAVFVARGRIAVERENVSVELVMDYDASVELCRAAGYPVADFLRRAREAGLTSVALSELTVGDLVQEGRVHLFTGRQILDYDRLAPVTDPVLRGMIDEGRLYGGNTYLFPADPGVYAGLAPLLQVRLAGERFSTFESERLGPFIEMALGADQAETLNVGLDPDEVQAVRSAGLGVVSRLRNYPGITPDKVRFFVDRLAQAGAARLVIFEGPEVLGYPDFLGEAADALSSRGSLFGQIEFASQKGDVSLARLMGARVVRVHSITEGEMEKISLDKAVDRFVRAARERGLRVMYLRPFEAAPGASTAGAAASTTGEGAARAIDYNIEYVRTVASALASSGFALGPARPVPPYGPDQSADVRAAIALVGAGILAGAFVLLDRLAALASALKLGLFGLGVVAYAALVSLPMSAGIATLVRQAAALGAALVFPVLAVDLVLVQTRRAPLGTGRRARLLRACWLWLEASGISVLGGVFVATTLSSTSFMLHLDQFVGVKIAHVVPLVVVAYLYWQRHSAPPPDEGEGFLEASGRLLAEPVRFWHVALLMAAAAAGLVYIARTGNAYFGLPIPVFDEKMRVFLEKALVFRPRSKEFLIGHPALILAAAAMLGRDRRLALPFALLGCIGQISMVNTFSHIHTPLIATLLRTAYGLVLGGAIGIAVVAAYLRLARGRPGRLGADGRGEERVAG